MRLSKVYEDAEHRLERNEITLGEFERLVDIEVIEPKRGEWLVDEGGWKGLDYYPPKCKCNQCGYEEELYIIHTKPTNYCPNCGCQMEVADDEQ